MLDLLLSLYGIIYVTYSRTKTYPIPVAFGTPGHMNTKRPNTYQTRSVRPPKMGIN